MDGYTFGYVVSAASVAPTAVFRVTGAYSYLEV